MSGQKLDKGLRLTVSTPTRTAFDGEVDYVLLRTVEGDIGIMHGHEPGAMQLGYGILKASVDKKTVSALVVTGGFASVREDRVTVMTRVAESPEKIGEVLRAMEQERADNKLAEARSDMEMHRAENALRRALVQMDVSSFSIIQGHEENE